MTAQDIMWLIGKTGVKLGANALMPGSGAAIDFADAANDFYKGDIASGVINTASGVFDLVSFGLWSTAKDTAKEVGKIAAINQIARETIIEVSEEIGRDASKAIAKKGSLSLAAATVKLNIELGKECVEGIIREMTERALYDVTRTSMQNLTTTAALSAVSSGGVNVTKSVAQGIATDLVKEVVKTAPKETCNSAICCAAKEAATATFRQAQKNVLVASGVKAVVVGGMKYVQ